MKPILVTSTADGTGKTAITVALGTIANDRGLDTGYMKPKGTRLESAVGKTRDEDPMLARDLLDIDAQMHQLEPVVYSPTFITEALRGRSDPAELRERISEAYEALSAERDVMLLEGGKLSTGGTVDLTDADIADLLDARTVLVTDYAQPGDVDDILAAAERLGGSLGGVLFNGISGSVFDEVADDVIPFLEGRGISTYGILPHDKELGGVTIEELADELGADVATPDASLDERIERFDVGAMGSKGALEHLRRTRDSVVITGGDRSDIQTTALEASGVAGLVLTGGYRPPKAVLGKAASRDVPVLLVRSDTRTTIDRVEGVLRSGRTQRRETVERMAELLEDNVDIQRLLGDS